MPHPAIWILVWMSLTIVLQSLQALFLPVLTCILLFIAYKLHAQRLYTLLRRTRWILFSLLLIYAFTTPGAALWPGDSVLLPTREGVAEGVIQLCRLVCTLSSLSILLTLLPRSQLIGGLYVLFYPLRFLRMSRERVAVRLALTLQYAESAMRETASDWQNAIASALIMREETNLNIELKVQPITRIDVLLCLLGGALLIWMGR